MSGINGKKAAVTGAVVGAVAAGLKQRQLTNTGVLHSTVGSPLRLSKSEWQQVLLATRDSVMDDRKLPTLAAGIAYYATLALFPFLAAAVAILALVITPEQINAMVVAARGYVPEDISNVIASQLHSLIARPIDNLLIGAAAIAVALFGASGASKSLVVASNVAYGVKESRGWLAQQLWGVVWTVAGIVFGFLVVGLLALKTTYLAHIGFSETLTNWLLFGRWIVILLCAVSGLSVFYKYGPNRPRVRWRWVVCGAVAATAAWMVATSVFFTYIQNYATFTQTYSFFAGIILLMIWMNLSALIVLVGAALNHQLEVAGSKKWAGFWQRLERK